MPTITTRLATACLVGGLALATAAPAMAQEESTPDRATSFEDAAARCQTKIDERLTDLATAQARLPQVSALTDAHEATINTIIDTTEAGLRDQSTVVAEATERDELAAACAAIATEFRVYLVVLPQTHLAVGADRVEEAVDRGEALLAELDVAIAAAREAGADVALAQALRDDASAHVSAAADGVTGIADSVLTVTPASWNDGDGQMVIGDSRTAIRSAHTEIKAGIEDGQAAIEAVRAAVDALAAS